MAEDQPTVSEKLLEDKEDGSLVGKAGRKAGSGTGCGWLGGQRYKVGEQAGEPSSKLMGEAQRKQDVEWEKGSDLVSALKKSIRTHS